MQPTSGHFLWQTETVLLTAAHESSKLDFQKIQLLHGSWGTPPKMPQCVIKGAVIQADNALIYK